MTDVATTAITAHTSMRDVLEIYPGAQRALFARYHIGGCQSCGFQPDETLGQVCARNENLPLDEVINHIQRSHESDQAILIEPADLFAALQDPSPPRLIDIRTREEFDAVKIPGATLYTQDLMNEIFASWNKDDTVILYDHTGERGIDAAAYLIGHGFSNTKCLRGGIDAYSRDADSSLPRYKIELD